MMSQEINKVIYGVLSEEPEDEWEIEIQGVGNMAYKKLCFTDEQIERANNISLMDYVNGQGIELKKVGTNSYKIEGYGGLYINPKENKWNCFSQDKGGGPIQFIMFMENKSWVESVKQLIGVIPCSISYKQNYILKEEKKEEKGKLILPEKNNSYKHMIAYLIKTRKIDKGIVYKLIKEKKLYEDKYKNCVFVGYDKHDNPRYVSKRGTNTNTKAYKGDVKNSDKSYPFCVEGSSNKVYVCEAPIEVMSYLTLFKLSNIDSTFNHHIISLGCLGDVALEQYIKTNPKIKEINLCLNNDKWGIKATNRIKTKYTNDYKVRVEYPTSKDFNEDLQNFVKTMEEAKNVLIESLDPIVEKEDEFELEI